MDRAFEAVECAALVPHTDSEHPALAAAANVASAHRLRLLLKRLFPTLKLTAGAD
jgi:hypothetical protein